MACHPEVHEVAACDVIAVLALFVSHLRRVYNHAGDNPVGGHYVGNVQTFHY
jgi:hypothetical protein